MRLDRQQLIDVALSAVVFACAAWVWWISETISGFRTDPLGPAAVPRLLAGLIGALAIALAISRVVGRRWLKPTSVGEDETFATGEPSPVRLFGVIILSAAYLAAMEPFGYILASPPYAAATLLLLGVRSPWRIAGAVAPMVVVLYITFQFGLGIPLPRGPF